MITCVIVLFQCFSLSQLWIWLRPLLPCPAEPIVQSPHGSPFSRLPYSGEGYSILKEILLVFDSAPFHGGWKPGLHAAPLLLLLLRPVQFPGDPHSFPGRPGWSGLTVGQVGNRQGYRLHPPCSPYPLHPSLPLPSHSMLTHTCTSLLRLPN